MAGETIGVTGLPDDCASQIAASTTYVFKVRKFYFILDWQTYSAL